MYEAYFGLSERPFSIAPDPRYLYLGARHRDALAHLLYGIRERGGFVQLTGEVGTGKTTLTRGLIEQLPDDVDLALILNPSLSVREFLVAICAELGIDLPRRSHSVQALMDALTRYLLDAYARGRHTVVLVDEAQNLSPLVLEQVRLLTNLETAKEKLLQIILVGQPELREMLRRPELRQVAQRITARYHLTPLSLAETRLYIRHRTRVAGVARPLFSRAAMFAIHRRAGGIPRLVNVICDRALLGAYAERRETVTRRIALRAAREVAGGVRRPLAGALTFVAGAAMLAAAGFTLWHGGTPEAPVLLPRAVAEEQPSPSLAQRLASVSPSGDEAFAQLFRLWRAEFRPDAGPACEQAAGAGLRCHYSEDGWEALRERDLPAVIVLRDQSGTGRPVLLTGLTEDKAALELGGQRVVVPEPELLSLREPGSVSLWRPPEAVKEMLVPGSRGAAVEWLVRRLDEIEGRLTVGHGAVFDRALAERVRRFQSEHGLSVDGVVGEHTLMRLAIAEPRRGTPSLRLP